MDDADQAARAARHQNVSTPVLGCGPPPRAPRRAPARDAAALALARVAAPAVKNYV